MGDFAKTVFLGNRIVDYAASIGMFAVILGILQIFRTLIVSRLKLWAARTATKVDDVAVKLLQRNIVPLLYLAALYLSLQHLKIPAAGRRTLEVVGMMALTIIGARFVTVVVNFFLTAVWFKSGHEESSRRSTNPVIKIVQVIIWGGAVAIFIENLGFNISAIIAGLGIGGVAVALAAQAMLGDLFSYYAILLDRPFELGDYIIVGDFMGTVEHLGIKTTRLRSLDGEQLIFSNTDLTNSRVRNYKRMDRRRVVSRLGVRHQTSPEQLRQIPSIVKAVIERTKNTLFDRAHFSSFGDYNLVIEVAYFVLSADYNVYMDVQQSVNLAIREEFARHNIQFAYPTQIVYVTQAQEPGPTPQGSVGRPRRNS